MFRGKEAFKIAYRSACIDFAGKSLEECSDYERYEVLVQLVKNHASQARTETRERDRTKKDRQIYYFSMEFLIGRLLSNYLLNMGVQDIVREALADLGLDLDRLCSVERDPGLGNGGLGRLAACFLDSMAFLGVPGTGMGIRYRFGLFQQKIVDGYQQEAPDTWLDMGYPWENARPDRAVVVKFGGYVDREYRGGKIAYRYKGYQEVLAMRYDVPVVGYGLKTVNQLRLWYAQPKEENFDLAAFNRGDYAAAMKHRNEIEAITSILYPDDSTYAGKKLRLQQEYLLVAAGIGDILRRYKEQYGTDRWAEFPDKVAIHINDTHPALCAPELMRLLMDEEGLEWDDAWAITSKTIAYTNHTVLPEALEKWPIDMLQSILPRVYMIIEEIDRRYRESLPPTASPEQRQNTAILWDGQAKMANLSVITSYSVNGVAGLHTEILKATTLKDFHDLMPEKFNNKTNGVSHRRFLMESNPGLTELITDAIGEGWKSYPDQLEKLLKLKDDAAFLQRLSQVKRANKARLAGYIQEHNGIRVDPDSVFDIQVKRIHAYKRQLLFAFKVMDTYNALKADPNLDIRPHTFIFAGKAAGSYYFAKEVIKLINSIAEVVNNDPDINDKIKVVFVENFCVSTAQLIYPAAEISEQISTAGKEASGTGNMKFMFNGAITLGTMDGANVEIHSLVGDENIRIFGMREEEVQALRASGTYHAASLVEADPRLKRITDQLVNGFFRAAGCDFWGIRDSLLTYNDEYFVLQDFEDYVRTWREMNALYSDQAAWNRISLHNIAKAGFFSSDRTIAEYARDIWHVRCDER
ncbi:MAG: glycogen/starch/alpha-glucan phosphorylase [Oscillospiraceae bacterium]|nr:glycogen/starch/alpha-glucan phosphorylase [Oscillospiraceae bacterium]